jgi:MFS family permease
VNHFIYWDHYSSLHNWVEQLNLTCVPNLRIGLIGSALFLGWAISCLIIPRLSDSYGRKKVFCISVVFNHIVWFLTLFSTNLYLTTFLMLCLGFMSVGRLSVAYFLLLEYTPKRWQSLVGSVPHIFHNLIAIVLCMYFGYVSKYWIPV